MTRKSKRNSSPAVPGSARSRRQVLRPADASVEKNLGNGWLNPLMAGGALLLLVAVVYWPTLDHGFIWDDETYIENNTALRSASGLFNIWFKIGATPQYYPLVHSTFWIEHQLWELRPRGYHVVNMLLHASCAMLLWRLLVGLRVPGAWLAAAIFAVHPVHVETVAWVTERKNVLSCLMALGSIWAYLRFSPPLPTDASSQAAPNGVNRWWYFALSLLLYLLALFSKTVACSVPAVLLVLYWWKRDQFAWRELIRLAPFFTIGLGLASLTVWMEKYRVLAVGDEWELSLLERILVAGRALWFYAAKLVWPNPLIFFYPRWNIDTSQWWQFLFPISAMALVVALFVLRPRVGRGPLAAVLIFAGVLVPALGFFNVYPFRFSFVADHFQYHASIALIALAAAGIALASRRLSWRGAMPLLAIVLLFPLAVVARQRTHVYHGLQSLYEDTIAQNPTCWAAHHNLGIYLESQGDLAKAIEHYRAAMESDPTQARPRINLGVALFLQRELPEAERHLTAAVDHSRDAYDRSFALGYLGNVCAAQQRFEEAFAFYQAAISENPDNWSARNFYAFALHKSGNIPAAVDVLLETSRRNPQDADVQNQLGKLFLAVGQQDGAIEAIEAATRLAPGQARFRQDLAEVLFQAGRYNQAELQLRALLELEPAQAHAHNLLGVILASRNDLPAAIRHFQAALRIDPAHGDAQENLARALKDQR